MVVADQGNWVADVVVVIEGTANISPYIESLKNNYIVPTLEHFNGGPSDDRDCGCDYNSTLYTLVVFMAADCAPEPSTTCFSPTPSTYKFISWLDKVSFIGGGGESCSNIAEGLSTALQVFDDFKTLRDAGVTTQKYCILICNSPPYNLPALENPPYSGLMVEQLATIMSERQINLSILSPRKIPALFKIYEKAGGDLQLAVNKNYAKDRRHLVLLKGYQLQEHPLSPTSLESKQNAESPASVSAPRSPQTAGQKRPATSSPPNPRESTGFKQPALAGTVTSSMSATPASTTGNIFPPPAGSFVDQQNNQIPQRPGVPSSSTSSLGSMNQPNPPNVTITTKAPQLNQIGGNLQPEVGSRPTRGQSPVSVVGTRMQWSHPIISSSASASPATTSVLASQLAMAPGSSAIRHVAPSSQNTNLANLVSHTQDGVAAGLTVSQTDRKGVMTQPAGTGLRGQMQTVGMRMVTPQQQQGATSGQNTVNIQLGQVSSVGQQQHTASVTPIQQSAGIPVPMPNQMASSSSTAPILISQVPIMATAPSGNIPNIGIGGATTTQQQQPQGGAPSQTASGAMKEKKIIWQGIFEYSEKQVPNNLGTNTAARILHPLPCSIASFVVNGETEFSGEKWPGKLLLHLIPKNYILSLFQILKNASRVLTLHFSQDSEVCQKLMRTMHSGSLVGCVQFPTTCDIRMMIVLLMGEKGFMGFVPNDQDGFVASMRQMVENSRKTGKQPKMMAQQQTPTQALAQNTFNTVYQLPQMSGGTMSAPRNVGLATSTNTTTQNIMMTQTNTLTMGGGTTQLGPRPTLTVPPQPVAQQQQQQQLQPQQNTDQAATLTAQQQFSALEAKRQQNLMIIQQLRQNLEAAQQKERQYKAAQEQQEQHQRQSALRQVGVQQAQQTALRQQLQQHLQQQQQFQRLQQQISQTGTNPQLRHLLQQQQQAQQQIRHPQQQQQILIQQPPPGIRAQIPPGVAQSTLATSLNQQQQQSQQNQGWDDANMLEQLL